MLRVVDISVTSSPMGCFSLARPQRSPASDIVSTARLSCSSPTMALRPSWARARSKSPNFPAGCNPQKWEEDMV